jgi:hypothetical protein
MNEPKPRGRPRLLVPTCDAKAQEYALRVWCGQSPDVPVKERVERVLRALEGQNLSKDGIALPDPLTAKYL